LASLRHLRGELGLGLCLWDAEHGPPGRWRGLLLVAAGWHVVHYAADGGLGRDVRRAVAVDPCGGKRGAPGPSGGPSSWFAVSALGLPAWTLGSCGPTYSRACEGARQDWDVAAERSASGVMAGNRPLLPGWCQSGYVASILSRRVGLPGLMWDLAKTALQGLYAQCAGFGGAVGQAWWMDAWMVARLAGSGSVTVCGGAVAGVLESYVGVAPVSGGPVVCGGG
jgi:hypothetical protein